MCSSPFVYLLWRTVCPKSFAHFLIGFLVLRWFVGVLDISWISAPYQIHDLQMFSLTLWVAVSLRGQCPLMRKRFKFVTCHFWSKVLPLLLHVPPRASLIWMLVQGGWESVRIISVPEFRRHEHLPVVVLRVRLAALRGAGISTWRPWQVSAQRTCRHR